MTNKTNPRKDFTQTAFNVFQQAIGEAEAEDKTIDKKKGRSKNETAQTEKSTPKESNRD